MNTINNGVYCGKKKLINKILIWGGIIIAGFFSWVHSLDNGALVKAKFVAEIDIVHEWDLKLDVSFDAKRQIFAHGVDHSEAHSNSSTENEVLHHVVEEEENVGLKPSSPGPEIEDSISSLILDFWTSTVGGYLGKCVVIALWACWWCGTKRAKDQ